MKNLKTRAPYEEPTLDLVMVGIEAGFAVSGGNPEDWKDSGNNWEQDE